MNRMINDWNSLPTSVVENTSINTLKSLLDTYLLDFRLILLYNGNVFIRYTGLAYS